MGEIREKMIRDIKTKGRSDSTVRNYVAGAERLIRHVGKPPEQITIEEIQRFHLHLLEVEKLSAQTVNLYMAGVKFLYLETLGMKWDPRAIPHTKVLRTIPVILSPEQVAALLNAVENLKYRTLLATIYSAGLRVNEAVHLAAKDIQSARHQIHVRFGKGGKERFTILSEECLGMLRLYWKQSTECKKDFLFPGQDPTQPIDASSVRKVLTAAKIKIGLHEKIRVHSLRHCFATHLLESGVDIRVIQILLGHASISSTELYAHLRDVSKVGVKSPLDAIAGLLIRL